MNDLKATLKDRKKTHGNWVDYATLCQSLKVYLKIDEGQRSNSANEALDNIAQKLARIVTGNPLEPDHWLDIAGYATREYENLMNNRPKDPGLA